VQTKGKFAYKVLRGYGINGQYDGWLYKNLLASYAHMRDTNKYHWAKRFVSFARNVKAEAVSKNHR
jgi:cobyrinic acid a,c-diamide synthase